MPKFIRRSLSWLADLEPTVLLSGLLLAAGAWGFIELADKVSEGRTQAFDVWLLQNLRQADDPGRPIGPSWVGEVARDLTALGGFTVLALTTLSTAGFLWLCRRRSQAVFVLAATLGGLALNETLKSAFHRPRPDVVPYLSQVYTSSFPSGHSLMAAVVYLTLGTLLAADLRRRRLKAYCLGVAFLLTVCVGISRVYMGVHYPTDVLAGWVTGLVWAILCWNGARLLRVGLRHGLASSPSVPEAGGPG